MKKVIILTFLVSLFACRKEKLPPNNGGGNVIGVTFKKDSSVMDQTIQVPKNGHITLSGILNTGSVNGLQATSVEV